MSIFFIFVLPLQKFNIESMLRHIVMLKFSARKTVKSVSREVEKMLLELLVKIEPLLVMEVG